jgi:anti-sigma factor RsiW
MSHADEGALHAYLDGALDELPSGEGQAIREHLAACPECVARLEEEQRIREEAIAILAGPLMTQVELPPFEELRLRAEATSPPKISRSSRIYRMGWAASVLLAIGAGWGLRGGALSPGEQSTTTGFAERVPAGVVASAVSEGQPVVAVVDGDGPLLEDLARPVFLQEEEGADVVGVVLAARDVAREDVAARDVAAIEFAAVDVVATDAETDAETLQRRLEGELVAPSLEGKELLDFRATAAQGSRLGDAFPSFRVAAVPVLNAEVSEEVRDERPLRSGRTVVTSASRSTAGGAFSNGDALERRRERRDSGRRGGDEGPLVVPEFEVIVVEAIEQGAAAGGTRALQWLTQADTLELLHLPEGVEPSDLSPLQDEGIAELVVLRDGLWLVMRARRRSVQELEGLLERLDANR